MPPGVPVATVAVDGSKNAAFLAARILSLSYPQIGEKLEAARRAARQRYEK
jgi:5-(carboxyamino)imidazole ribonucleotide mutase